jgi:glycolate oxidase iron-sulfur subunit
VDGIALTDEAVRQIEHCNKCGFCLPACPTYAVTLSEMHSPRGRLSLVEAAWRGEMAETDGLVDALSACLGCRACETACPSGVQYGAVLEAARAALFRKRRRYTVKNPAVSGMLQAVRHRGWLRAMVRMGRWGRRLPLPDGLRAVAAGLPERPVPVPRPAPPPAPAEQPVLFFETCVMSTTYPWTNRHAQELLAAAGARLMASMGEECCGALHLHSGDVETARNMARSNVARWRGIPEDAWIVGHAGGCLAMIAEYGHLLADDPVWAEDARRVAARARDFAAALADLPRRPHLVGRGERVALQNSCHVVNVLRQGTWPTRWLGSVEGDTFVALPGQDRCCGSAGVYNLNEPVLAEKILRGHLEELEEQQVDRWIVNNPGCALQCQSGIRQSGQHQVVTQLADYLYEAWDGTMLEGSLGATIGI